MTVAVAEEKNTLALAHCTLRWLDPLAPSGTLPHASEEAPWAALGIGTVVNAHDRFDGLAGLICMVERDGADVVVQNVCLDDAVEQSAANEAKLTVDGCSGSAHIVPAATGVVRKTWIGVLEVCNGNLYRLVTLSLSSLFANTYQASG